MEYQPKTPLGKTLVAIQEHGIAMLEKKLEQDTELLREVLEVVRIVEEAEQRGGVEDNYYVFTKFGMKTKAHFLIPKIEARLKEGT